MDPHPHPLCMYVCVFVCVCVVSISSENSQHEFNFDFYLAFIRFLNVERFNWIARDPDSISGWPPPAPPASPCFIYPSCCDYAKWRPTLGNVWLISSFRWPDLPFPCHCKLNKQLATCSWSRFDFRYTPFSFPSLGWLHVCLAVCMPVRTFLASFFKSLVATRGRFDKRLVQIGHNFKLHFSRHLEQLNLPDRHAFGWSCWFAQLKWST